MILVSKSVIFVMVFVDGLYVSVADDDGSRRDVVVEAPASASASASGPVSVPVPLPTLVDSAPVPASASVPASVPASAPVQQPAQNVQQKQPLASSSCPHPSELSHKRPTRVFKKTSISCSDDWESHVACLDRYRHRKVNKTR